MYKIDRSNLKIEKNFCRSFVLVGAFFLIVIAYATLGSILGFDQIEGSGSPVLGLLLGIFVTGICIHTGLNGMKKVKEKNKMYDYLEVHGKLVKGLKYQMQPTGKRVNKRPIYMIVAEYELESGSVIKLFGDARFDRKFADEDGFVDAIIDPNNPENCYLDFNIEESSTKGYDYDSNPIK